MSVALCAYQMLSQVVSHPGCPVPLTHHCFLPFNSSIISSCLQLLDCGTEVTPSRPAGSTGPSRPWGSCLESWFPTFTQPSPALSYLLCALQLPYHAINCLSPRQPHHCSQTAACPVALQESYVYLYCHISPRSQMPSPCLASELGRNAALKTHFWFTCPYPNVA